MATVLATLRVNDPIGLHSRPAGLIVKYINDQGVSARIGKTGEELVPANSPLRLMALKAKSGDELLLEINTDDHELADRVARELQLILDGNQ
jgi:phosphotransferase system HPr (HPr) family protein